MISVVIPLYNKSDIIERTLKSVCAQTYTDYEIVVVDDGSKDDSVQQIKALNIPNLRIISQANAGVSAARNRGIAEAQGEFVALLDADDEWHRDYLKTQHDLTVKYPQCDMFATNYEFKYPDNSIYKTIIRNLPFESEDGELTNYFEVASCSHPPIWTSAFMARKSAFEAVGGFPIGIKSAEDLLTWAMMAAKFRIAYSTKVVSFYNKAFIATHNNPATRLGGEVFVIDQLKKLPKSIKGIDKYVNRMIKIYAALLIESGNGHKALKVSVNALKGGAQLKHFFPFIVLSLMPQRLSRYIFLQLHK